MKAIILEYENLYKAWEGMNEYLFLEEKNFISNGLGAIAGSQIFAYDTIVKCDMAYVNQDFDFGKKLGYSKAKWTSLVNNYVNEYYLDMIRTEITRREQARARCYNYTYHFSNKYGSGKDCLISLTFSRRQNCSRPYLSFVIRTSEITKRLLFDFLLVQRICEYVYGHHDVLVDLYAQNWYITAESFVMYNNIKSLSKLYKSVPKENRKQKFQEKIIKKFKEYMNHPDPHNVMFRVNRRSMLQIQKGADGEPLSGVNSMIAKDLILSYPMSIPENTITKQEITKYKKSV